MVLGDIPWIYMLLVHVFVVPLKAYKMLKIVNIYIYVCVCVCDRNMWKVE